MSQKFVQTPSDEKKKIRELKFTLYVHGNDVKNEEEGDYSWACLILDRHENKTVLSGSEKLEDVDRIHLLAIIEGLKWIINSVEKKYRKHITVELCSDNVFCVNLVKEWIDLWKEKLDQKPNSDLLKEIEEIKSQIKIKPKWTSKTFNEYSWIVNKKANEVKE